jgi:cold shock CspA family protein
MPWPSIPGQVSEDGTIKWFRKDRGYGFVVGPDGRELFLHAKDCHPREPVEGDKGKFVIGSAKDGRVCARSVRIV